MFVVVMAQAQDQARPTIPAEMYQVDGPFSADQLRTVESYVDYYIHQLVSGQEDAIVDGRNELVAPMEKGGSKTFNEQYSVIVARKLDASAAMNKPAAPSGDDEQANRKEAARQVVVRLNTMVVSSRLIKDDHVINLILKGIEDENPAVRYWAVRAVIGGGESNLAQEQKNKLVTTLGRQVNVEQVEEVVRQLLLALIEQDAADQVLQALNEQIKQHVDKPRLTYDSNREAMRSLLRKIQVDLASGQVVDQSFRQLARAACRYMELITKQTPGAALDEETERDHLEMVKLCDMVLRQAHEALQSGVSAPPSIDAAAFGKNWSALQVAATQWHAVLMQPPFNFTEDDLATAGQ
ncbi:MAG: hypothetical protein IT445_03980 [Phycisphaeraceae bacterium]|nr:hypothetical protein [Phycisphaeraceae bacterium]